MPLRRSNPFTPTFGSMPFALAGRTELIDDVMEGLANRPGDPNRSTIFIGPRGSGKTVLLRAIAEYASEEGWVSVNVSAREGMLNKIVGLAREGSSHLIGPVSNSDVTSVQVGPVALEREVHREERPWWLELRRLVEELNKQNIGFLITVDELDPHCKELIDYIDQYQHMVSDRRDVALLMAGLPGKVSSLLLDESVSFIRRAFQRPLDAISQLEVEELLFDTIVSNGRQIDRDALALAAQATRGFAFAIQLVGYYLWRESYGRDLITVADAEHAARRAAKELERSIIEPTMREITPREREYLEAMLQDEGPSTTSSIAHRMGISMTNASNLRRRLIDRGVISEVRLGLVEFEMPMLREYLSAGQLAPGV